MPARKAEAVAVTTRRKWLIAGTAGLAAAELADARDPLARHPAVQVLPRRRLPCGAWRVDNARHGGAASMCPPPGDPP